MRQGLLKVISCITLIVSVFFCTSLTVLAEETDQTVSSDDLDGYVLVEGVSQDYDLSALSSDVGEYDYQGATSIHTQTSYGIYKLTNAVGNEMTAWSAASVFDVNVPVLFRLSVDRGHTYSGQIYFNLHMNFSNIDHGTSWDSRYLYVGLSGFEQQSIYDGVSVSYYGFLGFPTYSNDGTCDVTVCITFDNYQPTFTGTLNVNSKFTLSGMIDNAWKTEAGGMFLPSLHVGCSVSSDWIGELYDYPTDAIVDSDGTLIKNQTIQQQQIANQQSQQSQQQHNSLINGYDNAANDTMLADKNSVLKGFEQQQDQAMSDGQQYVADFSANYDTAPLVAMAPAFMMLSTWFNDLWGGMGNFSTVLIVGLMLCVAGYILKLKH